MYIPRVRIIKKLELNYTATDWELFDEHAHSEFAARTINSAIMDSFNVGNKREDVFNDAYQAMKVFSYLGATDSEPIYHLEKLLDKLYKE